MTYADSILTCTRIQELNQQGVPFRISVELLKEAGYHTPPPSTDLHTFQLSAQSEGMVSAHIDALKKQRTLLKSNINKKTLYICSTRPQSLKTGYWLPNEVSLRST